MKRHLCFIAALGMCLLGLNASADAQVLSPSLRFTRRGDPDGLEGTSCVTGNSV
jgi:hypothetical protein